MIRVFLLAIALLLVVPATASAQDRFGRDGTESLEPAPEPSLVQKVVSQIAVWQRQFNRELRREVRKAKNGTGFSAVLGILGLSFLYGVFHAAGPGHGKMVTTTWFLTRKSNWRAGALMGGTIALIQALSALAIVGFLGVLMQASPIGITEDAGWIEMVSYLLVSGLGVVIAMRILQGKDSCGHKIGEHDHHHDHSHHPHGHACSHGHHHHAHDAADMEQKNLLLTAAAVGIRPCTGALLVLLFTLANGIFWVGVLGTFAMAIGVAITVTLIGTGAIALNRLAVYLPQPSPSRKIFIQQSIGFVGAVLIIAIGLMMLAGTATRQGLL